MSRHVLCLSLVLSCGLSTKAQAPVLAPTTSTTIDINATSGQLTYSSISIPAGVTVTFTGDYPVLIDVAGDVQIDGVLSVMGDGYNWSPGGPGAVFTGTGFSGSFNWVPGSWSYGPFPWTWIPGYYWGTAAQAGWHASLYGTATPFDLRGGSPGGYVYYWPYWSPNEQQSGGYSWGGGGGGTLVIEAQGHIIVNGKVTADGEDRSYPVGDGAGGSILLRGLHGCDVSPGGTVTAMPEGIIRLDSYRAPPQLAGTVQPTPTIMRFPDLTEVWPPVGGSNWKIRVRAPRGDTVFVAAAFLPGSGTNAYGTLGIDLGTAIMFVQMTVPTTGHDPFEEYQLPIPNDPQFVGLDLWVQGLDWFTSLPPTYTQTIHTWVR